MGVWGLRPRNFTTNFLKFVKFLLNHQRNIVIVTISQKFRGAIPIGGGAIDPHAPMVATALTLVFYFLYDFDACIYIRVYTYSYYIFMSINFVFNIEFFNHQPNTNIKI